MGLDEFARRCPSLTPIAEHGALENVILTSARQGRQSVDSQEWRRQGATRSVVVTTISLDSHHEGYKKGLVEKLSRAAREHIAASKEAEAFMLVNRLRDWNAART